MIKFLGLAICTLLSAMLLKNYNKTYSLILSIIGCASMFLIASNSIVDIFNELLKISRTYSITVQYLKLMMKILGLTLISQFVSDLCRENGEIALSSMTLFISKITIVTLILPIFEVIIDIVVGLVK